jgi:hypothetical protein
MGCSINLWEFTIGKQKYGLPMDEDWGTRQRFAASKCACATCSSPHGCATCEVLGNPVA